MFATTAVNPDVWRFQAHPEVWLLVFTVSAMYVYAVRVIGPKAVPTGETVVTRRQIAWFVGAVLLLWAASDWPIHDLAEEYLYFAHMFQHMALSYFMPAMVLLATPTWLMRLVIGEGRPKRVVRTLCRPVVAGALFNVTIMVTHIPAIVNRSAQGGPLHYSIHVLLVTTSLLMWMPVIGPIPEWRLSEGGKMIYLFIQSIVPTVPAGWLTFAEGVVYKHYDVTPRVWGVTAEHDQQLAGAVMKVGGSIFLWTVIVWLFFKRFAAGWEHANSYKRVPRSSAIDAGKETRALTFDEVARAFEAVPPPEEPAR